MKKRAVATAILSLSLLLIVLTGCATQSTATGPAFGENGTLILRVNPEISVHYNKDGLVTKIDGLNDDGTAIVKEYDDYVGKECRSVVQDLVGEINKAGYFVNDVDGNARTITIQIEAGSVLPEADFLQTIAADVQNTVAAMNLNPKVLNISTSDYDNRYAQENAPSSYITKEKAMEMALLQAGVHSDDAVFTDRELDLEQGRTAYELEFVSGGVEFEYVIDAKTGAVLTSHKKGVTDYGDTDYGPNNDGVTDYDDTDYGPNNDGVTDYGDTDYGPNNDGVTDYGDSDYGPNNDGVTDYGDTDYGPNNDGVTDYGDTDYGPNNDGVTDYGDTDYGPNNDGVTDYGDTDYGPNNDGVTDYGDTDYGPNNDGVTDYGDTDYGPNNDGVTDYGDTDYGPNNDGVTDYGDSDYGPNSDGVTDYGVTDYSSTDDGNSGYGTTNYSSTDDGNSGYGATDYSSTDDGNSGYGTTNYSSADDGNSGYGATDYSSADDGNSGYDAPDSSNDSGYGDSAYGG